jgi:hypothetical protein
MLWLVGLVADWLVAVMAGAALATGLPDLE